MGSAERSSGVSPPFLMFMAGIEGRGYRALGWLDSGLAVRPAPFHVVLQGQSEGDFDGWTKAGAKLHPLA
ncbi:hypothetical protein SAT01_20950 [Sinomonas atrocyanea]|nr:hypothetical protein SAT01_20950 [Sinomonas atrocyanea]GGG72028.1 hypothetical protein GCM10007172_25540 [Sinomonas atrocyanea]